MSTGNWLRCYTFSLGIRSPMALTGQCGVHGGFLCESTLHVMGILWAGPLGPDKVSAAVM